MKNKKGKSIYPYLVVVLLVAVIGLFSVWFYRSLSGGGQEPLPVSGYSESPRNYVGNVYQLEGRVDTLLGHEAGAGRMLLVREVTTDRPVALFIGPDVENFSPNPGQVFRFRVEVDTEGLLSVQEHRKL